MSPKGVYVRKSTEQIVQEKIDAYSKVYEIENPNDLESVKSLVSLEIERERLTNALKKISPSKNPRDLKALHEALADVNNSYLRLQQELGVSRRKRTSEDESSTPKKEWEDVKQIAKHYANRDNKKLVCPECGEVLGHYYFYIEDNNDAEPGSIASETSRPQPMKYTVRIQCWKCAKGDRPVHCPDTDKWERVPPKVVFAEISNE
jgi:hypothetical protein